MAALVTLVAFLVQLYSLGYLAEETPPALGRYYLYQSLFAFSMLGLVFAPNFLQLFIFWELVGLCSYLLIGFYYQRPAAARAAVKAFWVTKLGDVGFLLGIVLLWGATGTFEFDTLFRAVAGGTLPVNLALYMGLIYLGAVGKSAQFPLHVWLPDAMEGPTPVSALIHAATMVTAGVFLVARAYPLYLAVPWIMLVIAYVGAFTALLAATLALGESDIKRVLAYSTVSQLGYMMAALGAGALAAGVLHLLLHGFFKALLFLAAGAVIHAVHTNDMGAMGRLARAMPRTAVVFLVGTLALAGVPPFSGFVSKEAILGGVWEAGLRGPFVLLSVTVFLTAFYMFRAVFLTFFGARGAGGHPHDPPGVMMGPLWILALLSIVGAALGGAALGLTFPEFLRGTTGATLPHGPHWLTPFSVGLALAGVDPGVARLPAPHGLRRGPHAGARAPARLGGAGLRARRALRRPLPRRGPRARSGGGVDRPVRGRRAGERGERRHAAGGHGPPPAPDRPRPGLPLRRDRGPPARAGVLEAVGVTCPVLALVTATPLVAAVLIMLLGRTRPLGVRVIAVVAADSHARALALHLCRLRRGGGRVPVPRASTRSSPPSASRSSSASTGCRCSWSS